MLTNRRAFLGCMRPRERNGNCSSEEEAVGVASGFFARTERTTSHRRQPVPARLAIARSSLVPVPDENSG